MSGWEKLFGDVLSLTWACFHGYLLSFVLFGEERFKRLAWWKHLEIVKEKIKKSEPEEANKLHLSARKQDEHDQTTAPG